MDILIIVGAIVLVIALFVMISYNSFIKLRNKVKEAFSTMDVFLKKRFDLVPSLVTVVKGYASHEANTLEELTKIRTSSDIKSRIDNENQINEALQKIMVVAEAYPQLKANENFLDLQNQLSKIEEEIAFSRRYYNGSVREFNNKCQMVPSNIIANMFGFKPLPMFEATGEERQTEQLEF